MAAFLSNPAVVECEPDSELRNTEQVTAHLMDPDLVKEFIAEFQREVNRQSRTREAALERKQRELKVVTHKLDGLIDAIADGLRSAGLQAKLQGLEEEKAALETEITAASPSAPRLHPSLPNLYRRRVAELGDALSDPDLRDEALNLLRGLVERVEITPEGKTLKVEFIGDIANMLILPSPAEASSMARHKIAVKGVAGGRN